MLDMQRTPPLVVASVFVVGTGSQQHVHVEAQALDVCTSAVAASAGLVLPAEALTVLLWVAM